ncbi:MAG: type II toxin-antitoxin system VapC family toxin [Anaerolineae bacterium]
MNGKYLLDTNIIISLFAGEAPVKDKLGTAGEVFVPSIVIGELCFGARKSGRVKENLERIDEFAIHNAVLECNTETARRYGQVKNALRVKGQPIPENDLWIASIALEHDLTLITRDMHFAHVPDLAVVAW